MIDSIQQAGIAGWAGQLDMLINEAEELINTIRITPPQESAATTPRVVSFRSGPLYIDYEANNVTINGEDATLTPLEHAVLVMLARCCGRPVSFQMLRRNVWHDDSTIEKTIRQTILTLRKSLRQPVDGWIKTVAGKGGYMLDLLPDASVVAQPLPKPQTDPVTLLVQKLAGVVAQLKAQVHPHDSLESVPEIYFKGGGLEFSTKIEPVYWQDKTVTLPLVAREILALLIAKRGCSVSRDDFLRIVCISDSYLSSTIHLIRKTFGITPRNGFIQTDRFGCYKFTLRPDGE